MFFTVEITVRFWILGAPKCSPMLYALKLLVQQCSLVQYFLLLANLFRLT